MLIRKGFRIQTVREHTTIILAFQDGTWYRSPKQVVLELSPIEDSITRVDVTAIIEARKKDPIAEEVMEENIVSAIYQNFKSTT